jgi:pyrroloquinoline quinone biosynthesis protein B
MKVNAAGFAATLVALLALAASGVSHADEATYLYVLGVAQDAGYPQAGCYQPHCMRAWEDERHRRLVSSIAVVDEAGGASFLFDATPDVREQLYRLERVAPGARYPLSGVFLTHAHMGHYTGLVHFGFEAVNADEMPVYAMPRMLEFLSTNGPWDQLVRFGNIALEPLADGKAVPLTGRLSVTPFRVPHRDEYSETVGFRIEGPARTAVFLPDIDKWERWQTDIRDVVRTVDYVLVDATFHDDDELPRRDMSAVPHPFVVESMALFAGLADDEKSRVIFIHMNHTNPLLVDGSEEQERVREAGFRIAYEGMRLEL